jgi:hypothetical protein
MHEAEKNKVCSAACRPHYCLAYNPHALPNQIAYYLYSYIPLINYSQLVAVVM